MSFKRESTFFFHVQSIDSKKLRKTKLEKQNSKYKIQFSCIIILKKYLKNSTCKKITNVIIYDISIYRI